MLLIPGGSTSQSLLQGKFGKPSIKVGEIVSYHLTLKHPQNTQVVFPSTTYSYFPFELVRKIYYNTSTRGRISTDSAIYQLRTFELKDTIVFGLSVFAITSEGDSTPIRTAPDTILLMQLLPEFPASDNLQENIKFKTVKPEADVAYYLGVTTAAMLVVASIFLLFRKRIVRRYRLYVLTQGHKNFIRNYEKLESEYKRWQRLSIMENALTLWKVYLSRLENSPINTYTTTEIISLFENEDLVRGLQIFDRSIYSGIIFGEPEKAFSILKKFSRVRFQKVRKDSYG